MKYTKKQLEKIKNNVIAIKRMIFTLSLVFLVISIRCFFWQDIDDKVRYVAWGSLILFLVFDVAYFLFDGASKNFFDKHKSQ